MKKLARILGFGWFVVAFIPTAMFVPYEKVAWLWWVLFTIQCFGLYMLVRYRKIIWEVDNYELNYDGDFCFKLNDIVRFREERNGRYGNQLYEVININPLTIKCLLPDFNYEMIIDVRGIKKVDKKEIEYFYSKLK